MFRIRLPVGDLFAGLDLVPPGVADVTRWLRYGQELTARDADLGFTAGLARKPWQQAIEPARVSCG